MTVNVSNFELSLVKKSEVNQTGINIVEYAKAIQLLKTGAVFVVNTVGNLPDATINEGKLYYVETDEAIYWSNGTIWQELVPPVILSELYTWGFNTRGHLGDNSTVNRSSPGTTAGGGTTWCQVSGGLYFTAAIKTDGTLWTWGRNDIGQLGTNTIVSRSSPETTAGAGTDWCQVSGGQYHTAAVKTDGTLWAWGFNNSGRLGDNSVVNKSSPVTTAGGGTTWCQVSGGSLHTAAVKTDGTLWTWGFNSSGQLGTNTTVSRSSPGTTAGGGTTWCQVSGGSSHTAAIKTDGTLWTWGCNTYGILGTNTTVSRSSPGTTAGGGTTWCQVSSGGSHTAAIKTDGTLWTWGRNDIGQLGTNTIVSRSSPGTTAGGGTTWCQSSISGLSSLAVKTDGTLWTWGRNAYGKLGDNSVVNRSSPGTTAGGGTTWCQVSGGYGANGHIMAIKAEAV